MSSIVLQLSMTLSNSHSRYSSSFTELVLSTDEEFIYWSFVKVSINFISTLPPRSLIGQINIKILSKSSMSDLGFFFLPFGYQTLYWSVCQTLSLHSFGQNPTCFGCRSSCLTICWTSGTSSPTFSFVDLDSLKVLVTGMVFLREFEMLLNQKKVQQCCHHQKGGACLTLGYDHETLSRLVRHLELNGQEFDVHSTWFVKLGLSDWCFTSGLLLVLSE